MNRKFPIIVLCFCCFSKNRIETKSTEKKGRKENNRKKSGKNGPSSLPILIGNDTGNKKYEKNFRFRMIFGGRQVETKSQIREFLHLEYFSISFNWNCNWWIISSVSFKLHLIVMPINVSCMAVRRTRQVPKFNPSIWKFFRNKITHQMTFILRRADYKAYTEQKKPVEQNITIIHHAI